MLEALLREQRRTNRLLRAMAYMALGAALALGIAQWYWRWG